MVGRGGRWGVGDRAVTGAGGVSDYVSRFLYSELEIGSTGAQIKQFMVYFISLSEQSSCIVHPFHRYGYVRLIQSVLIHHGDQTIKSTIQQTKAPKKHKQ